MLGEERREFSNAMSIQELSRTMEYHSGLENLDEDGYTQLDFSSRDITRRPVVSEKGIFSFCLQNSHFHQLKPIWGENLRDVIVGILLICFERFSEITEDNLNIH